MRGVSVGGGGRVWGGGRCDMKGVKAGAEDCRDPTGRKLS